MMGEVKKYRWRHNILVKKTSVDKVGQESIG